jgi:hypothetical protein
MRERFASDSGIEWKCADVRDLPEPSHSVDVAFDKGTLDAMIFGSPWDPPEMVKENTGRYMDEVGTKFDSPRYCSVTSAWKLVGSFTN